MNPSSPPSSAARGPIDLAAYLGRIGLHEDVAPDLQTLRAIIGAHVASIPFENLDPFRGVTVDLDMEQVQRKLLHDGRGGYCFEQNVLLGEALREIGFKVTNLAARVLWGRPDDAITPRSHMLLRVDLGAETWLADAGFGGNTPTGPLRLVPDVEQQTPHEPFRLRHPGDDDWRLQVRLGEDWKTLYRFDLQPQYPVDYLASNYWLSARADSHFVANLVAARAPAGRRLALGNRRLSIHAADGTTEQHVLRTTAELREVLRDVFLIRLPQDPSLDPRLDTLPE